MAKDADANIKFDRAALGSDDLDTAQIEREKLNSPIPTEEGRANPASIVNWPIPEDRKPAVMLADAASTLDYKAETIQAVDSGLRQKEADLGTGEVARQKVTEIFNEGQRDANEVQAPPTKAAQTAADGGGMVSAPIPVVDAKTGEQTNAQLANKQTPQRTAKK